MALNRSSKNLWVGLGCILSSPCAGERVQPRSPESEQTGQGPLPPRDALLPIGRHGSGEPLLSFLGANVWGDGLVLLACVGLVPSM